MGLFVGRSISNAAEVGEKASKAERFARERSGDSTSIAISGEYWGLLFAREWGESEPRCKWTGDEERARADQVLPFEGTVNGATGRATVAARGV
jgi:hypothetical protein